MSVAAFVNIIQQVGMSETWEKDCKGAISALFEASGRYTEDAGKAVGVRHPAISGENAVPYAALIQKDNPTSGAYSGMSFAIFPVAKARCLLTFVVGTNGISPDDEILGNPGHARKVQALCAWLNREYGGGKIVAWAKHDPVRIDEPVPASIQKEFPEYSNVFSKYGSVLYGIFAPPSGDAVEKATKAFLDLMFDARGFDPRKPHQRDRDSIRNEWQRLLLPEATQAEVTELLASRRFVILQGPPGTGKTRLAGEILETHYGRNGISIQFHPNTTYETFVGGLAPTSTGEGLQFVPTRGHLLEAAAAAKADSKPYLLHIDEVNRADISKILGEAIFLLESKADRTRTIGLGFDFGEPFGRELSLPENLHILGTMNTSDRSLAIVDVAVRRRFAFVNLWPQLAVVQARGGELANEAFGRLLNIFIDHASGESFNLVPGHSYFLTKDDDEMKRELRVTLAPLLDEYLAQGYIGGFSEHIRGYLQWIASL